MTIVASSPAASDDHPHAERRPPRSYLWAHAAVLFLVLAALIPLVGGRGQFSADEGAALVQADHVANGDGWTFSHPFPEADPGGESFPFELSQREGDRYAPFGKHPLYVVLLVGVERFGEQAAAMLLSVGGTVAAAVLSALIARRIDRRLAVPTLWATGLATPLLFDGYLVIAHTLGAALASGAVLLVLRAAARQVRPVLAAAGIAVLAGAAVLLRTEALLFAVALAIAAALFAMARRQPALYALSAGTLAGAATAFVLERWWVTQILGGGGHTTEPLSTPGRDGVGGRILGFVVTVLLPSYRIDSATAILRLLAVAATIAAAIVIRRRPDDSEGLRVFGIAGVIAAAAAAVLGGTATPGLLPAMPFIAIGLLGLPRLRRAGEGFFLASTVSLFAAAVLATQYSVGGNGEWGWRYFALALPALVPLCVWGLDRLRARLDRRTAAILIGCVCAGSLATSAQAVRRLHDSHTTVNTIVDAIRETTSTVEPGDGGSPVVLTTSGVTARFAWDVVDQKRWLTVSGDDLAAAGRRLRDLGVVRVVVIVGKDSDDVARVTAMGTVEEERVAADTAIMTVDLNP